VYVSVCGRGCYVNGGAFLYRKKQKNEIKKKGGEAGYRSLCLLHAKQALYHLSYIPRLRL
jgi:hypothetical protein